MSDAMSEEEIIKFHEEHRGDLSLWEEKPIAAQVKKGSVVFSLRFSREELELLRARAEVEHITVAEFIRRAAMREAGSPLFIDFLPQPHYAVSWGTTAAASWPRHPYGWPELMAAARFGSHPLAHGPTDEVGAQLTLPSGAGL